MTKEEYIMEMLNKKINASEKLLKRCDTIGITKEEFKKMSDEEKHQTLKEYMESLDDIIVEFTKSVMMLSLNPPL